VYKDNRSLDPPSHETKFASHCQPSLTPTRRAVLGEQGRRGSESLEPHLGDEEVVVEKSHLDLALLAREVDDEVSIIVLSEIEEGR
jgi:hypothetical protein